MLQAYIDHEKGLWHVRRDGRRRQWLLQRAVVGQPTQTVALYDCPLLARLNLEHLASAFDWRKISMPREGARE